MGVPTDVTADVTTEVLVGVPVDVPMGVPEGMVVERVKVKLAVLIDWLLPEFKVSTTVYVLVSTTCGVYPEVMVVVRTKVDTRAAGAEGAEDPGVGNGEITDMQPSAPGQSLVRVTVPVMGEPPAPSESV